MIDRRLVLLVLGLAALWTAPAGAKESRDKPYAPSTSPPLAPDEAQKKFKVPAGFEMRLFAAEPDVLKPVAMSFDEKGRLWVVELFEYPDGAPKGAKGRDRVVVLEDTKGTGKADKFTVFADGLSLATAVFACNGGVYVGQAPDLYFYPIISDGPDGPKAGPRQTVLTGFGLDDRHELLNSFCYGPDGWIYFTTGVFTHSLVSNPAYPNEPPLKLDAGVCRYHPLTKKFELFADGVSNQWGVDFDRAGNAFVSACVVDHIWHIAPGGVYKRQGGVPNVPFTYELLGPINKDKHRHHMAAYGGINVYQGDLFPEEYRGTVFMGNIHGDCLDHDKLTPDGSSFTATDMRKPADTGEFLESNDGWFRPVSEQVGPDGALWIMDWYDKYPCYQNSHAPDLDKTHGRIWRLVYTGNEANRPIAPHAPGMDLGKLSDDQLVGLLSHLNVWQRRTAQRLLSERQAKVGPQLKQLVIDGKTLEARLAALWTLHSTGNLDEVTLDVSAADTEPAVRTWAARLTGERGNDPAVALARLLKLSTDPEPAVLAGVAEACLRLASADTTQVLTTLVQQKGVDGDPNLPFMIWRATEPKIAQDNARGAIALLDALAESDNNPAAGRLLQKCIHRLCDMNSPAAMQTAVAFINSLSPTDPLLAAGAIDGLLDGQKKGAPAPPAAASLDLARFASSPDRDLADKARRLGAVYGNAAAAQAALKAIADPSSSDDDRIRAIALARQLDTPASRAAVESVLAGDGHEAVKLEAIRALGEIGDDASGGKILATWKTLSPASRRSAADILVTRLPWSKQLLAAVQKKVVSTDDVPPSALRTLSRSKNADVQKLVAETVGRYRESDVDKVRTVAAKKQVVLDMSLGAVDLEAGHTVMQKTCLVCHTFYGEGAAVGPDLTGVGRSTLDALLTNVIDPNQIVGAGYENTIVETKDKRSLSGRVVENTEDHVKLLSAGPKEDVIAKSNIASMRMEKLSVMPEGLEAMPDADFRNLMWYVYSPHQDDKEPAHRMRIDLGDKKLTVSAKLPGGKKPGEMVPLMEYVMDPAKKPYVQEIRDPAGSIVIAPGEREQSGVYTHLLGLNKVEGGTGERFVKLLDLQEGNDRVTWRAITHRHDRDGVLELEEEQTVTVHAVDKPNQYVVDFDWTLRAPDSAVIIHRCDAGGLFVELARDSAHLHLNSNGETGDACGEKEAAWCDASEVFAGGQTAGIAILEHPANFGFPAAWNVNNVTGMNPSVCFKRDWSIDARKEKTFRYRLIVHTGPPDPKRLNAEFKDFARVPAQGSK